MGKFFLATQEGNSVSIHADAYLGRESRQDTFKIITKKRTKCENISVTQTGAGELSSFDTKFTTDNASTTLRIIGQSNSELLKIYVDPGDIVVKQNTSYNKMVYSVFINDVLINDNYELNVENTIDLLNGSYFSGSKINDPGASDIYNIKIEIPLDESGNTSFDDRNGTAKVVTKEGVRYDINLVHSATAESLSVSPKIVTIKAEGGDFKVNVTSNTTWTIE